MINARQKQLRFGFTGVLIVCVLCLGLIGCSDNENDAAIINPCPIMPSKEALEQFYVDHEGERYYLCCQICIGQFQKNPKRWIKRAEELKAQQQDTTATE